MDPGDDIEERRNVFIFGGYFSERQQYIQAIVSEIKGKHDENKDKNSTDSQEKDIFVHEEFEISALSYENCLFLLWNFSDKEMTQGIAQLFVHEGAVVVVLLNNIDVKSHKRIVFLWKTFAFKGITDVIIANGTIHTSKEEIEQALKTFEALDEINLTPTNQNEARVISRRKYYRNIEEHGGNAMVVSNLLTLVLTKRKHNQIQENAVQRKIQHQLILLRRKNVVFCSLNDLESHVITENETINAETIFCNLAKQGVILRFCHHNNDTEQICINPVRFAKLIFTVHIDSCNKTFRIAPSRFWPHQTENRPDSASLVKVIEDIPYNGLIRPCLFPLLWQDLLCDKEQIFLVVKEMERLGLLVPCRKLSTFSDVLSLTDYPQLSSVDQLSLLLMGKMTDLKPSLNWYEDLQTSDIQLQFTVTFSHGVPCGFLERCIGVAYFPYTNFNNYHYGWKSGLLLRICDVYLYMSIKDESLDIFVRTDVDIFASFEDACQELWLTAGLALEYLLQHILNWPDLKFQTIIRSSGEGYKACFGMATSSLTSLLINCYVNKSVTDEMKQKLMIMFQFRDFTIENAEKILEEWIYFVYRKATEYFKCKNKTRPVLESDVIKPNTGSRVRKKNKGKDITWNVILAESPATSSTESLNNQPIKVITKPTTRYPLQIDTVAHKHKRNKTIDLIKSEAKHSHHKDTMTTVATNFHHKSDAKHIHHKDIMKAEAKCTHHKDTMESEAKYNHHKDIESSSMPKQNDQIKKNLLEIIHEDRDTLVRPFVAAILANAVATYIAEESNETGKWSQYQASVATEMAEAIMFVNSNDVMAAAKTIINTVDKVEKNVVKHDKECCIHGSLCCGQQRPAQSDSRSRLSSVCVLL